MELAIGGSLRQRLSLAPGGRFRLHATQFYLAEIVLALEWLHSRRFVYLGLTADSVLLTGDGHVLLTGLALAQPWRLPSTDLESVEPCGPREEYFPPEVIRLTAHGVGADFWALGVLAFEMLVGLSPFVGAATDANTGVASAEQLFMCVLQFEPPIPDDAIPPTVRGNAARALLRGLLEKDVRRRLGSREAGGAAGLRQHAFFTGLNWEEAAARRLDAAAPHAQDRQEEETQTQLQHCSSSESLSELGE